mgnify:CR=1 FL=1
MFQFCFHLPTPDLFRCQLATDPQVMTLVLRWFWCNHPICFYSGKLASNRKEGLRNCIETQRWKITQKSHSATLRQYLSTRDILGDI